MVAGNMDTLPEMLGKDQELRCLWMISGKDEEAVLGSSGQSACAPAAAGYKPEPLSPETLT